MKIKKLENTLVFCGKNDEAFTTSKIISHHAEVQHHTITRLIRDNKSDLEEFGVYGFEIHKPSTKSGGRPEKIYYLNEQQATLLLTYLKNTDPVRRFKKELVRQFYTMREIIMKQRMEKQSEEWKTVRLQGKEARKLETDAIKLFVSYAEMSGSKNAFRYYSHFTDLANSAVGIDENGRQYATTAQLLDLRMVETVISRSIMVELANSTEYHQAYRNIKDKVFQLSALALKGAEFLSIS